MTWKLGYAILDNLIKVIFNQYIFKRYQKYKKKIEQKMTWKVEPKNLSTAVFLEF